MNLLSALSIAICTAFFVGAGHIVTAERKGILNTSASAVLISLGWWSFCNAFFFAATTQEQAWFWHKLSAIGWCGFVALTVYYFVALTDHHQREAVWWKQALFFTPPLVLTLRNLFGQTTSLAQNIIQSTHGWGWTYENSITSFWLWAYLCYVLLYFSLAFFLLYRWAKAVKHTMKKEMAIGFIILDTITVLFGVVTDVILPLTNPVLPALASIGTAFFGLGYFGIIYWYDLFNINLVISSDDILQTSNNSLFVMDENQEILKYNHAVGRLLGYNKTELIGLNFTSLAMETINLHPLASGEDLIDLEAKMRCKDGTVKDILLSASIAKDKRHSFLCIIVSCQDVSRQKKIQAELELEQARYKALAKDYQKLAYYDPLTGLPNRRKFLDVLDEFVQHYQAERQDFAVLFLDLDHFKHTNDVYGHQCGDELLKAAADKLKACVESNEFVARLGGDEFMIIMPYTAKADVDNKAQRIHGVFCQPVLFDGYLHEMSISAGYSIFSQVGDAAQLMQQADEAMYQHKKEKWASPILI